MNKVILNSLTRDLLTSQIATLLIPETLDLTALVEANWPPFGASIGDDRLQRPKLVIKKCALFLNHLYFRKFRDHSFDNNGWANLHSDSLSDLLGNSYRRFVAFLIQQNVIEEDNSWHPKKYSKGYRFTERYATDPKKSEFLLSKSDVRSRREVVRRNRIARQTANDEITQKLERILFNLSLEGDVDEAFIAYSKRKQEAGKQPDRGRFFAFVEMLRMKDQHPSWFCSRGEFGRLCSPVTNCPRELRAYLRYRGERMIEIDQRGSQPFLLITLYKRVQTAAAASESRHYYDLWNPSRNGGDFYANLLPNFSRERVKDAMIKGVLNRADYHTIKDKEMAEVSAHLTQRYQGEFPILWSEYQKLKALRQEGSSVERDYELYKQFAHEMHRIESRIFIDGVAVDCVRREIPIYTVHDCVACLHGDVKTVKSIIEQRVLKECGFLPFLKC